VEAWRFNRDTPAFLDELNEQGFSHDTNGFLQVRHILRIDTSIYPGLGEHVSLIVISPLARTVDCLDSEIKRNSYKMTRVFNFIPNTSERIS